MASISSGTKTDYDSPLGGDVFEDMERDDIREGVDRTAGIALRMFTKIYRTLPDDFEDYDKVMISVQLAKSCVRGLLNR